MRKIVIVLFLLVPVLIQGQSSPYNGMWLNKQLFDRLASGVEPRVALKNCGNPTSIDFYFKDALMISWNNNEGARMLYKVLEDGSIETLGVTPSGIKMGMRYRMLIHEEDGIDVLSVYSLEPREEKQDDLVRYPDKFGTTLAPLGMIISRFLTGDYSPAGYPDSTISIQGDGRITGWEKYRFLRVGINCAEESLHNHVYLSPSDAPGRKRKGNAFVWERSGDTLIFYDYTWEDVLFNGVVGNEFLRLIKQ